MYRCIKLSYIIFYLNYILYKILYPKHQDYNVYLIILSDSKKNKKFYKINYVIQKFNLLDYMLEILENNPVIFILYALYNF